MIRLGQRRRIPRERVIGEETVEWFWEIVNAAGWLMFMVTVCAVLFHLQELRAMLQEMHIAIVVGGKPLAVWP
jgi:hypothetical protein